ncbi:MAG: 30S ribosomal protein S6 [Chlamydiota bacterium]
MKKMKKNLYEGMYVISTTLSEESRKKALEKILDGITEKSGEIRKVHEMGRKRLAYTIKGKKEGYYYLVYFEAPCAVISDLWKEYHLHEDLIRFMTLQIEQVPEKPLEFKPLKQV